jgi:hypothetical protein
VFTALISVNHTTRTTHLTPHCITNCAIALKPFCAPVWTRLTRSSINAPPARGRLDPNLNISATSTTSPFTKIPRPTAQSRLHHRPHQLPSSEPNTSPTSSAPLLGADYTTNLARPPPRRWLNVLL